MSLPLNSVAKMPKRNGLRTMVEWKCVRAGEKKNTRVGTSTVLSIIELFTSTRRYEKMTRRDGYAKLKSKPITIYHKQVFTIQNKEYIIFTDTQSLSSATRRPAFTHSRAVPQPQPQPQPQPPVTTTGPHSIDHSLIVDSSSSPMLPRSQT